jgi:Flp pilus assembly protein TadB
VLFGIEIGIGEQKKMKTNALFGKWKEKKNCSHSKKRGLPQKRHAATANTNRYDGSTTLRLRGWLLVWLLLLLMFVVVIAFVVSAFIAIVMIIFLNSFFLFDDMPLMPMMQLMPLRLLVSFFIRVLWF